MPFKFPPSSLFAISEHRAVAISAAAEVLRLFHLFTPSVVWLVVASAENKFVSIVSPPRDCAEDIENRRLGTVRRQPLELVGSIGDGDGFRYNAIYDGS